MYRRRIVLGSLAVSIAFVSLGCVSNPFESGNEDLVSIDVPITFEVLESHGLATILAEPNLTTLSGTEANFRAGGQFPIPVSQALGTTTVQFVNFGVSLNFTPDVIENGLIDPGEKAGSIAGTIECRERLGGMLRYYYRDAA